MRLIDMDEAAKRLWTLVDLNRKDGLYEAADGIMMAIGCIRHMEVVSDGQEKSAEDIHGGDCADQV